MQNADQLPEAKLWQASSLKFRNQHAADPHRRRKLLLRQPQALALCADFFAGFFKLAHNV